MLIDAAAGALLHRLCEPTRVEIYSSHRNVDLGATAAPAPMEHEISADPNVETSGGYRMSIAVSRSPTTALAGFR